MLILLPPSEGKSAPLSPTPFDIHALSNSDRLTALRLAAIHGAGINPAKVDSDEAISIYNGVLYKALDWGSLSKSAKKRGEKSIRIISALFGVITPTDRIFAYKSKIKNSHWKTALAEVLDSVGADVIVDCRSSTYKGAWNPPNAKTVEVRVFQSVNGKLSVITHMSKKYRGELVRHLLLQKSEPKTIPDLLDALRSDFYFEFVPATQSTPHLLNLIVESLTE